MRAGARGLLVGSILLRLGCVLGRADGGCGLNDRASLLLEHAERARSHGDEVALRVVYLGLGGRRAAGGAAMRLRGRGAGPPRPPPGRGGSCSWSAPAPPPSP